MIEDFYQFDSRLLAKAEEAEKRCFESFSRIDETCAHNEAKVLRAFADCRVSESHFAGSTGYGYGDRGREVLDAVYAQVMGAEDALVRHNFVSGTHALTVALFGVLRAGDTMVSLTGAPYDTMEEVIGIRGGDDCGSLKDFGVSYRQVDLKDGDQIDYDAIRALLRREKIKLVLIQRSRGYAWRDSLTVAQIGSLIRMIKETDPDVICMVDNCYGEFVEEIEPTQAGADIIVGSLIKNAGGGLALSGGYVAGRADLVEKISYRLTAPGLGRHTGASLGFNRNLYQGLFQAPHVVGQSIKTAVLCAGMFEKLGFAVCPAPKAERSDIIQAIRLKTPENVIRFCQAIQKGSPIDSYVTPEPWDMPGYEDPVIMAAGAFVQGASIELSADAPICPPYVAYMQGGTIYDAAKIGILRAADAMSEV